MDDFGMWFQLGSWWFYSNFKTQKKCCYKEIWIIDRKFLHECEIMILKIYKYKIKKIYLIFKILYIIDSIICNALNKYLNLVFYREFIIFHIIKKIVMSLVNITNIIIDNNPAPF